MRRSKGEAAIGRLIVIARTILAHEPPGPKSQNRGLFATLMNIPPPGSTVLARLLTDIREAPEGPKVCDQFGGIHRQISGRKRDGQEPTAALVAKCHSSHARSGTAQSRMIPRYRSQTFWSQFDTIRLLH